MSEIKTKKFYDTSARAFTEVLAPADLVVLRRLRPGTGAYEIEIITKEDAKGRIFEIEESLDSIPVGDGLRTVHLATDGTRIEINEAGLFVRVVAPDPAASPEVAKADAAIIAAHRARAATVKKEAEVAAAAADKAAEDARKKAAHDAAAAAKAH